MKMPNPELRTARTVRYVTKKKARRSRLLFWQTVAIRVGFFAALFLVWYVITSAATWNRMLFPTPVEVFKTLGSSLSDGSMLKAIAASMKRLVVGYGLSLLIGIPLGLMLGRVKWLDDTIGTLSLGFQALPSICWLPLAILWFGLSEGSMLFVIVMGSLMAVILSVRDGVKKIPRLYLRASRVLGATGWKSYYYVIFPASLPSILSGAKIGWSFAWRSLMAAELLYVNDGLGSSLMMARELHDMTLVVSTMIVIVIIGLLFDRILFGGLERAVHRRWGL
jgi:NitT/TauT family transport system permease protein